LAIDVLESLHNLQPSWRLLATGRDAASRAPASGGIVDCSDDASLAELMNSSTMLLSTAVNEGFGLPGLELASRTIGRWSPRWRWNKAFDHRRSSDEYFSGAPRPWPTEPWVFPSWDNTARRTRGEAFTFTHSSPEQYRSDLNRAVAALRPSDPPLVFVNAWNEWAEGCHLEPCDRWGRTWIDVTRSALGGED
jgi:hypothetical protein